MKDSKFIQSILDKIGEFGDGPLEFETRDIERLCNLAKKSTSWKYPEKEMPIAYETGEWDGKRSDEVVVEDDLGSKMVVRLYEGFMDGNKFQDWIDADDYFLDRKIVRWLKLPV